MIRLSEIRYVAESVVTNSNDVEGICKKRDMYMKFL